MESNSEWERRTLRSPRRDWQAMTYYHLAAYLLISGQSVKRQEAKDDDE